VPAVSRHVAAVVFGEGAGWGLVVDVSLEGCRIRSAAPMHKGD